MIEAKIICDSIGEHSPRLTTFLTRYPKFIHAEHMRHRTGSYCVSSSRAVPVAKNLEEVRSDELRAAPVWWGREQKGMQSGEELDDEIQSYYGRLGYGRCTDRVIAKAEWKNAALRAVECAESLIALRVHKSIVNRLLEPFLHVNVLVTSVEPGLFNFFGLRLDKTAQPEMRVLAEQMWAAWNESKPQTLRPDEWHLPFIQEGSLGIGDGPIDLKIRMIQVSVARCARLSYTSFETGKRSTIEEDLKLYNRLVGSHPIHASPAEHQATPDKWENRTFNPIELPEPYPRYADGNWNRPYQHGNLPGWRQYRKMLAGESIAPLSEEYRNGR